MGKTSAEVKNRYNAKAYDRIALLVKKGQKDKIREHAISQGCSLQGFIKQAVVEKIKNDTGKDIVL